jgi:hypothetical protein
MRIGQNLRTSRHHGLTGDPISHGKSAPGEALAYAA